MILEDLCEHPNDRGILTQGQFMSLANDWRRAGEPMGEDFDKFIGNHPLWGQVPVYFFINTVKYLETLP